MEESEIFDKVQQVNEAQSGFHDFKLLRTSAHTSLYLAYKAGKRFAIKATKDNTALQTKIMQGAHAGGIPQRVSFEKGAQSYFCGTPFCRRVSA